MHLDLPSSIVMKYSVMVRLLPLFGVGLVMFLVSLVGIQQFNLPDIACGGFALVTLLLFIPLWQMTNKVIIEASSHGITSTGWRGAQRTVNWSEIAKVTYSDFRGDLMLWDAQGNRRLTISSQREHFPLFTVLLQACCPALWQERTAVTFRPSRSAWGLVILMLACALAFLWGAMQQGELLALGGGLFFGVVALFFARLLTRTLTIDMQGITIRGWGIHQHIAFTDVDHIGWSSISRQGATYYTPVVTLTTNKTISLGGFGDSVSLLGIATRRFLEINQQQITVRWGAV